MVDYDELPETEKQKDRDIAEFLLQLEKLGEERHD
jgi:hypothetical protein